MLSRGPELRMELVTPSTQDAVLKISSFKGKKYVFRDEILISNTDAQNLKKIFSREL